MNQGRAFGSLLMGRSGGFSLKPYETAHFALTAAGYCLEYTAYRY